MDLDKIEVTFMEIVEANEEVRVSDTVYFSSNNCPKEKLEPKVKGEKLAFFTRGGKKYFIKYRLKELA